MIQACLEREKFNSLWLSVASSDSLSLTWRLIVATNIQIKSLVTTPVSTLYPFAVLCFDSLVKHEFCIDLFRNVWTLPRGWNMQKNSQKNRARDPAAVRIDCSTRKYPYTVTVTLPRNLGEGWGVQTKNCSLGGRIFSGTTHRKDNHVTVRTSLLVFARVWIVQRI